MCLDGYLTAAARGTTKGVHGGAPLPGLVAAGGTGVSAAPARRHRSEKTLRAATLSSGPARAVTRAGPARRQARRSFAASRGRLIESAARPPGQPGRPPPPEVTITSVTRQRRHGRADLPADHRPPAGVLGAAGLRRPAAVPHRGRRRHVQSGHLPALSGLQAVAGGLRRAEHAAGRRPLRREPVPAGPLLPVPGGHQAVAAPTSRTCTCARWRPSASTSPSTTCASWKTTGRAPPWAPGASAGRSGSTAWRPPSSPTSSSAAGSTWTP